MLLFLFGDFWISFWGLMDQLLDIQAGDRALAWVRERGLAPEDVAAVFGASGAAKWLSICGLDAAIFGSWLQARKAPLPVFGTSIGAFKLAAAARRDAKAAIDEMAAAYVAQRYDDDVSIEAVNRETQKVLQRILPEGATEEVLAHPFFRFHCAAVRCQGLLRYENKLAQLAGFSAAFVRNAFSRAFLNAHFVRTLFHDARSDVPFSGRDGLQTERCVLSPENFREAILASASIPMVMQGVANVAGAVPGMYRDGGLLDYHPLPEFLYKSEGVILYPHFYSELVPGWLDKAWRSRRPRAEHLRDVILISPSRAFVESLPDKRIPDRNDFKRYFRRDDERMEKWQRVRVASDALGEVFLSLVSSGELASFARPFK